MTKQPDSQGEPLAPVTQGESLADYQKRMRQEAWDKSGSKEDAGGDALVVEEPTLKSVHGHAADKQTRSAKKSAKKSTDKGK